MLNKEKEKVTNNQAQQRDIHSSSPSGSGRKDTGPDFCARQYMTSEQLQQVRQRQDIHSGSPSDSRRRHRSPDFSQRGETYNYLQQIQQGQGIQSSSSSDLGREYVSYDSSQSTQETSQKKRKFDLPSTQDAQVFQEKSADLSPTQHLRRELFNEILDSINTDYFKHFTNGEPQKSQDYFQLAQEMKKFIDDNYGLLEKTDRTDQEHTHLFSQWNNIGDKEILKQVISDIQKDKQQSLQRELQKPSEITLSNGTKISPNAARQWIDKLSLMITNMEDQRKSLSHLAKTPDESILINTGQDKFLNIEDRLQNPQEIAKKQINHHQKTLQIYNKRLSELKTLHAASEKTQSTIASLQQEVDTYSAILTSLNDSPNKRITFKDWSTTGTENNDFILNPFTIPSQMRDTIQSNQRHDVLNAKNIKLKELKLMQSYSLEDSQKLFHAVKENIHEKELYEKWMYFSRKDIINDKYYQSKGYTLNEDDNTNNTEAIKAMKELHRLLNLRYMMQRGMPYKERDKLNKAFEDAGLT